jgi:hypothetical protein
LHAVHLQKSPAVALPKTIDLQTAIGGNSKMNRASGRRIQDNRAGLLVGRNGDARIVRQIAADDGPMCF